MLPYIREEGFEEASGQTPPDAPPVDGVPSNGTGGHNHNEAQEPHLENGYQIQEMRSPQTQEDLPGAQQEYLTVSARGENARRSTILLVGLFIIGLLCLWFMIKKSSPRMAKASLGRVETEDAQIEAAISRLVGVRSEMFSRMDEIVKKFYEFSDVQQVKVDELAKNPFKREIFLGGLKKKSDTEKGDFGAESEIMRREQMRQQIKHMRLLSIVSTGSGKCCIIDDKRLYEGDSIGGLNVHRIGDRTVSLESDGIEIELKLSE